MKIRQRILSLFSISFLVCSCQGQVKKEIILTKKDTTLIEKFDIEEFNKDRMATRKNYDFDKEEEVYITEPVLDVIDTLSDGTIIQRSGANYEERETAEYSEAIIPPPPAMFMTYKRFYPNGNIKVKYTKYSIVNSFVPSGIEYYYNEKGELIKKIDNNKLYEGVKITPDILFDILEKEKIYDRKKRPEGVLTVYYRSESAPSYSFLKLPYKKGDIPFWEVYMIFYLHDGNPPFKKIYKVDAITGEVTEISKISLENSIEAASNDIKTEIYKTYKGKEYTEEEWKIFEQKQFEEYARTHNISIAKNENKGKLPPSRFLLDD